jgi:hypothetical protein
LPAYPGTVRRLAVVALATLVCLAVVTSATARPVADRGWTTHKRASAGFALDTPATWLDVTSSSSAVLDQAAKSPELRSLVQIAKSSNLIKFLSAAPAGFPNVNVIEVVSGPITLDAFVTQNVAGIKRLSFVTSKPSVKRLRLPAGPAALVTYREAPQGNDVQTLQYYLVHNGRAYVVTYTTQPTPDAATVSIVTRSARSFRFVGVPVS